MWVGSFVCLMNISDPFEIAYDGNNYRFTTNGVLLEVSRPSRKIMGGMKINRKRWDSYWPSPLLAEGLFGPDRWRRCWPKMFDINRPREYPKDN